MIEHPLQLARRLRDRLDDPSLPVAELLVLLRRGEPGAWANPTAPLALLHDPNAAREGTFALLRVVSGNFDTGPDAMPELLEQAREALAQGKAAPTYGPMTPRMKAWCVVALERAAPLVVSMAR